MSLNTKVSIVTVTYNDSWQLHKTAKSVSSQTWENIEYIVIDGKSQDQTHKLCSFWQSQGLLATIVSERDEGIYDAMNKGINKATGDIITFLNTGDVYAHSMVIEEVVDHFHKHQCDALIGWGTVGEQVWATWLTDIPAARMSSLGFCHQSLFITSEAITNEPFDSRRVKTDSDTIQFANLIKKGKRVNLLMEVLSHRSPSLGVSAYSPKSTDSVTRTLTEYYGYNTIEAESIINFRRKCKDEEKAIKLLNRDNQSPCSEEGRRDLAIMILDTIHMRQSVGLSEDKIKSLASHSIKTLGKSLGYPEACKIIGQLTTAQKVKAEYVEAVRSRATKLGQMIQRQRKTYEGNGSTQGSSTLAQRVCISENQLPIVSLTSFPARIRSVDCVVRSILQQTVSPKHIYLTLGRDEFPSKSYIPSQLRDLEGDLFTIVFTDTTHHSYDKYIHLPDQTGDVCIVDDDVIYKPIMLELLLTARRKHPEEVIANRAHQIRLTDDGTQIAPYKTWKQEVICMQPSHQLLPTGAGGVLYPGSVITSNEARNKELLLALAPYADDVWLKVVSLLHGRRIVTTDACSEKGGWYMEYTPTMKEGALHSINVDRGLNDLQISLSFNYLAKMGIGIRSITDNHSTVHPEAA
ncbi:glycosyltransferase [Cyanobium sp. Copco_Reservoir_LC18]|uniref:glycosyltransferase n=1 Tax=Cyanobium sp. Copco_Reservoir_LC18 TaxID=1328305 RepID=UPI0013595D4E|nr:glycosyltransferase [Cyanobium sp. Copco_Reservoir_LC18]